MASGISVPCLSDAGSRSYSPRCGKAEGSCWYRFEGEGEYVGIVLVGPDDEDKVHRAVFPFAVGYTDYGYWPFVMLALFAIQLVYLWSSGWLARQFGRSG